MRVRSVVISLVVSLVASMQVSAEEKPKPKTIEEAMKLVDNCSVSCMKSMKEGERTEVYMFKDESKKEFICSAAQVGGGDPCGSNPIFAKGRELCKSKGKPITTLVSCTK